MDEDWVCVPGPADSRTFEDLESVTVDGETFAVRRSDDGVFHYEWITGPNPGYGFNAFGGPGSERGHEQLVADIRDFLAGIDPATGYLRYP